MAIDDTAVSSRLLFALYMVELGARLKLSGG